jgi:hypothetical protein
MSRGAGEGGKEKKAPPTPKDIVHADTNFWVHTAPRAASATSPFARNEQIAQLFHFGAPHCDNCEYFCCVWCLCVAADLTRRKKKKNIFFFFFFLFLARSQ